MYFSQTVIYILIKVIRSATPRNNFFKMFIYVYSLPIHVSALVGHLHVEYRINYWKLLHLQWIVVLCALVLLGSICNIFGNSAIVS
jgi:hypothetical protein